MPLLLAAPSGWGRGGRVVAAPVEFHLSGGATFCRRSSSLEECHHRRRARGRRGSRPDERCAELRLLRRTWPLGGRGNSYFISPRSQGGCSRGGARTMAGGAADALEACHLQRGVTSYGRSTSPGGEPPLATDAGRYPPAAGVLFAPFRLGAWRTRGRCAGGVSSLEKRHLPRGEFPS